MADPAFLALDTAVLLGLAAGHADAAKAIKLLREQIPGGTFVVTPAPITELAYCVAQLAGDEQAVHAALALRSLRGEWGFQEIAPAALPRPVVAGHVSALFAARLLRPGCQSAAETLVEAALHGCRLLLTWDHDLADLSPKRLRATLVERGLAPLRVMTPRDILRQ